MCECCQDGRENPYGDVYYATFPCAPYGAVFHYHPRIIKRNNRYLLIIDGFSAIEIKACPICGRQLGESNGN